MYENFARTEVKTPRSKTSNSLSKPLEPESLIDHREDDESGDYLHGPGYNAEMRWEAMSRLRGADYLTPTDRFFVRNHAPTPAIDPLTWELRIEGPAVGKPLTISYKELLRLPSVSVTKALECAGNGRIFFEEEQGRVTPGTPWRLGAIGVAKWTGVPLREILDRADISTSAREVMAESLDDAGMRRPLSIEKALDDALIAYGMNGEALPPDHGFPARLIVPGWAAVASVKWLGRLRVSDGALFSPWNTEKYVLIGGEHAGEPVTRQRVKSALELPWPATVSAGPNVIRGRSWSPDAKISRVEYSFDGENWERAALEGPNLPGAWGCWSFLWKAKRGEYEVQVRATDSAGESQPRNAAWNEQGYLYNGYVGHKIHVL